MNLLNSSGLVQSDNFHSASREESKLSATVCTILVGEEFSPSYDSVWPFDRVAPIRTAIQVRQSR